MKILWEFPNTASWCFLVHDEQTTNQNWEPRSFAVQLNCALQFTTHAIRLKSLLSLITNSSFVSTNEKSLEKNNNRQLNLDNKWMCSFCVLLSLAIWRPSAYLLFARLSANDKKRERNTSIVCRFVSLWLRVVVCHWYGMAIQRWYDLHCTTQLYWLTDAQQIDCIACRFFCVCSSFFVFEWDAKSEIEWNGMEIANLGQ